MLHHVVVTAAADRGIKMRFKVKAFGADLLEGMRPQRAGTLSAKRWKVKFDELPAMRAENLLIDLLFIHGRVNKQSSAFGKFFTDEAIRGINQVA